MNVDNSNSQMATILPNNFHITELYDNTITCFQKFCFYCNSDSLSRC